MSIISSRENIQENNYACIFYLKLFLPETHGEKITIFKLTIGYTQNALCLLLGITSIIFTVNESYQSLNNVKRRKSTLMSNIMQYLTCVLDEILRI